MTSASMARISRRVSSPADRVVPMPECPGGAASLACCMRAPTSAVKPYAAPGVPPCHCITTTLVGASEPCPTPNSAPMPSAFRSPSSSISTSSPSSCIAARRAAKSSVVRILAGSFTRSRVKNTPSAIAAIGPADAATASGAETMKVTSPRGFSTAVLCAVKA
ncbi:hypothetical protein GALL_518770 [mine drainage metagenome]|uniref:Uncharacterized protein n=1 Tax=mine drainage metagenome TaxID=410659 RepID=A0A1J5P707_9ZZZZ